MPYTALHSQHLASFPACKASLFFHLIVTYFEASNVPGDMLSLVIGYTQLWQDEHRFLKSGRLLQGKENLGLL